METAEMPAEVTIPGVVEAGLGEGSSGWGCRRIRRRPSDESDTGEKRHPPPASIRPTFGHENGHGSYRNTRLRPAPEAGRTFHIVAVE